MSPDITSRELHGFRDAAQSLKLYRRAELLDASGDPLIESLYVDPLPHDHALATMLKPTTTFLIGRKGTGKSTIFQRAQHELRRTPGVVSAYVDIKTVYESSQVDPRLLARALAAPNALPQDALKRLLLYRAFLETVVAEIRDELRKWIRLSVWQRVRKSVGGTLDQLFTDLDTLLKDAGADHFVSVLGTRHETGRTASSEGLGGSTSAGAGATLGPSPAVSFSADRSSSYSFAASEEREYADILMRVFDIKAYMLQLKRLLQTVGVERVFVFVDDFSELPPEAMQIVVDSLLAPLNNWSDELVKFKIAAYPGRIYYGDIDKTKIDEITLDIYSLYGTSDIGGMEDKAVDFTQRLIERRLDHYGAGPAAKYFGPDYLKNSGEIWRQLFSATMANPRNLGYVLLFLYESHLIYDQPITTRAIGDAARRYYDEKIDAYFNMNRFLHESFEERSSIFSLKDLFDDLVSRARDLRRHRGSAVMRELPGRPPTSHFHIAIEFESLLTTLELNFFLTKYYVMKDRDGRKVAVYALNYGLCQKESIQFGRPSAERAHRLYFVERVFDYTAILQEYVHANQEIVCDHCGATFDNDQLPALQMFGMLCSQCRVGQCVVTNLSRKYEAALRAVDESALLPRVELGILHTLGTEPNPLFAAEVAGDLDCSYQLVGKRAKILADRGLVNRGENDQGRRLLSVTETARQIYLGDSSESE